MVPEGRGRQGDYYGAGGARLPAARREALLGVLGRAAAVLEHHAEGALPLAHLPGEGGRRRETVGEGERTYASTARNERCRSPGSP